MTPQEIAASAAAAAAVAVSQANAEQSGNDAELPDGVTAEQLESSGSVDTERLSPGELPPRFN